MKIWLYFFFKTSYCFNHNIGALVIYKDKSNYFKIQK